MEDMWQKLLQMHTAGDQDMLPQNVVPSHMEYFKLKEFEEWMYRMDFLTGLLSKSKNPNERYLPLPRGKDYPYI